jgi:4-hydroxybenzoate polyprenyltransferase
MLHFLRILFHKLRLSKPWRYKAPFLISVPYFFLLVGGFQPLDGLEAIGWSFMTILGIAGFGYWANDFSDRDDDRKAGKANAFEGMPLWQAFGLLGILLSAAVLPWVFFFPIRPITIILLGAEFGLFILYSLPPFRFKERGFLGVLADSGYAHVVPALLAAATFQAMAPETVPHFGIFLMCLGVFQGFLGLRNIMLHQLGDFDHDLASKTRTWVVTLGLDRGWQVVKFIFFPLECLGFVAYLGALSWLGKEQVSTIVIGGAYPVFLILAFWQLHFWYRKPLQGTFQQWLSRLLDEFYVEWLPVCILGLMVWKDALFWPLAIIHFVVFPNGPKRLLLELVRDRILPRIRA